MKIIGQSSILPIFSRPKKVKKRSLPWRSFVPPDSVDVQLIPRRNLYGRAPLRFRSMGTASTQLRDALLIYQDEINPFPKDMPSQEELSLKLEEIQEEFEEQRALSRGEPLPELSVEEPPAEQPEAEPEPRQRGLQVRPASFRKIESSRPSADEAEGAEDHGRRFADWVQQVTVFD